MGGICISRNCGWGSERGYFDFAQYKFMGFWGFMGFFESVKLSILHSQFSIVNCPLSIEKALLSQYFYRLIFHVYAELGVE